MYYHSKENDPNNVEPDVITQKKNHSLCIIWNIVLLCSIVQSEIKLLLLLLLLLLLPLLTFVIKEKQIYVPVLFWLCFVLLHSSLSYCRHVGVHRPYKPVFSEPVNAKFGEKYVPFHHISRPFFSQNFANYIFFFTIFFSFSLTWYRAPKGPWWKKKLKTFYVRM